MCVFVSYWHCLFVAQFFFFHILACYMIIMFASWVLCVAYRIRHAPHPSFQTFHRKLTLLVLYIMRAEFFPCVSFLMYSVTILPACACCMWCVPLLFIEITCSLVLESATRWQNGCSMCWFPWLIPDGMMGAFLGYAHTLVSVYVARWHEWFFSLCWVDVFLFPGKQQNLKFWSKEWAVFRNSSKVLQNTKLMLPPSCTLFCLQLPNNSFKEITNFWILNVCLYDRRWLNWPGIYELICLSSGEQTWDDRPQF